MNEELLRSPSNHSHPKSIRGSVLPTVARGKNPQEFQRLGKRVGAAEKNRRGNVRSSVGEAPFGVGFDDQLGLVVSYPDYSRISNEGEGKDPWKHNQGFFTWGETPLCGVKTPMFPQGRSGIWEGRAENKLLFYIPCFWFISTSPKYPVLFVRLQ